MNCGLQSVHGIADLTAQKAMSYKDTLPCNELEQKMLKQFCK